MFIFYLHDVDPFKVELSLTAVILDIMLIYWCSLFIKVYYGFFPKRNPFLKSFLYIYYTELSKYLPKSVNIFNAVLKKCHICQLLFGAVDKIMIS